MALGYGQPTRKRLSPIGRFWPTEDSLSVGVAELGRDGLTHASFERFGDEGPATGQDMDDEGAGIHASTRHRRCSRVRSRQIDTLAGSFHRLGRDGIIGPGAATHSSGRTRRQRLVARGLDELPDRRIVPALADEFVGQVAP